MSCSHCISSLLTDFVCYFCRSLSFLLQFFPSVVFLCRSFPFLRHCCIFVFRCSFPTVFRQFSAFLFAFSVILFLSYISICDSLFCLSFLLFPTSLLCICLSMSYSHCISSILSDFLCLFCRSFVLPTSALSLLCLSLSLLPLLRSLLCICLSLKFPHCISSILSDLASYLPDFVVCLLSLSFYSFLYESFPFFDFPVVPSLCFVAVFCCRLPTVFRQFSPSLFAFSVILSLSYVSPFLSLLSQSFFFLLTSLLYICLSMSFFHCFSSILTDFVCYFCLSLSFLRQFFPYFVFLCRSFSFLRHYCIFVFRCSFPTVFRQFSPFLFAFSVILFLSYISIFDSLFCLS